VPTSSAAVFNIDLQGNISREAPKDAQALQGLRSSIESSQQRLRAYNDSLRTLTGKSAEVLDARQKFKAAIDREKSSINQASVQLAHMGQTVKSVSKQASGSDFSKGIEAAGGPVADLGAKLSGLQELFAGGSAGAVALGAALALVAVGVVAVTGALVAGAVAFGKWVLGAADAERTLGLTREAFTGSAETARNLGTQVDALAKKVPTARAELNQLAADTYATFRNTTLSGQGIVDQYNLIAQASAAMGNQTGKALGDIIERSKRYGRVRINPLELQGTGIKFDKLSANLAKEMGVGTDKAKKILFQTGVDINVAAKAMRKTVEDAFGSVNARKTLSFDVALTKLHESLSELTKDVHLEPLSVALGKFFGLFDQNSFTGHILHEIVTSLGDGLVNAIQKSEPLAEDLFEKLVLWSLKAESKILDVWDALDGTNYDTGLGEVVLDLKTIWTMGQQANDVLESIDGALKSIANITFGPLLTLLGKLGSVVPHWLSGDGSRGPAEQAGQGPAEGATRQPQSFEREGTGTRVTTAPAHADGGTVMAPAPGEAFASVAPGEVIVPNGGFAGSQSSSSGPTELHVHINVSGGTHAQENAATLSSPSFLGQFQKVMDDLLKTSGVPSQEPA
jgi:hypothetical protein